MAYKRSVYQQAKEALDQRRAQAERLGQQRHAEIIAQCPAIAETEREMAACGAELICDETTAATSCPYCGNNTIIPGTFAGTQRPDWVIPFKSDKKDAVNALKSYYKGKVLLPGTFSNNNHLEEIKGVYVPFWLYSGDVEAQGRYEAKKDQVFRQGEYQITRSEHYAVERFPCPICRDFLQINMMSARKNAENMRENAPAGPRRML